MPQATRSTVPNRFTKTGRALFWPSARITFSNKIAGPPAARTNLGKTERREQRADLRDHETRSGAAREPYRCRREHT